MEERIARLERANRRWRALAVGLIVAGLAAAAASDDRLYVKDLKVRELSIVDEKMNSRIVLSAFNDAGAMSFRSARGDTVVALQALGNGVTALGINGAPVNGKESKAGIIIIMDQKGNPALAMVGAAGKIVAKLPAAAASDPDEVKRFAD